MDVLPFEIVILIASDNPITFAHMIQASRKVSNYIKTPAGHNCFLAACRKKQNTLVCKKTYLMFTDRLHSFFDKPAYITTSGITMQYKDDKPLVLTLPSTLEEQIWYQNGLMHRDNGPAVIYANGNQVWYKHGKTHKTDGPALIYADGSTEWWYEGMRHRVDGPAVTHVDKSYEWPQINRGNQLLDLLGQPTDKPVGQPTDKPVDRPTDKPVGRPTDKPVDQLQNIDCEWWVNNVKHRIGFPAVIYADGGMEWWQNGNLHREDGPASIGSNGDCEWWINGMRHRIDGPAITNKDVSEWWINGKRHRDDGPAILESSGDQFWFKNGKRYREGEIIYARCIGIADSQWW